MIPQWSMNVERGTEGGEDVDTNFSGSTSHSFDIRRTRHKRRISESKKYMKPISPEDGSAVILLCWGETSCCSVLPVSASNPEDEVATWREINAAWYTRKGNWRKRLMGLRVTRVAVAEVCYNKLAAEQTFVDIWQRVSRAYRLQQSLEWELRSLRVIQAYSNKLISIHTDVVNDYSKHFGEDHSVVLQHLWTLAELTRPQPSSVGYYRRIFEILNKDSNTCDSRAFEPLVIVITELIKQERYQEALRLCQILFNTLQHPRVNAQLRDSGFVRAVYDRYVLCLQMTHADAHVIHDVTVQYRKACITVFGAQAAITIHATQTLAFIAQGIKQYEAEATELFESLLEMHSSEVDIDYENIRMTLEAIYEGHDGVDATSTELTTQQFHRVVAARVKRLSSIRETYGWAHESYLSQMEEVVSLYEKRRETQAATALLQETTIHIVSSEQFSSQQVPAAKSIVSSYRAIGQVQRARKLSLEIYRQMVAKDTTNTSSVGFDLSSSQRHSLLFLAQLEYSLRDRGEASLTMPEIYSSLVAEVQYFERFQKEVHSKSSTLQSVLGIVSHLRGLLLARGQAEISHRLLEQFTDYFMSTQGQKLELNRKQASVFLSTILDHFQSHSSQNFLRSIVLATQTRVIQLLQSNDFDRNGPVCDLALAAFKFARAHDGFASITPVKLLFKMGLAISNWAIQVPQAPDTERMLQVSGTIIKEMLGYCKSRDIDLTCLDPIHLNSLIKSLDKEKDYQNLAWLLILLWEKRQKSRARGSDDTYTPALGRMLAITLYLVGDYSSSIRLAEDIVYNCARVHGPRHSSTIEMTILLSQMAGNAVLQKAAALHENALRVFVDPSSAATAIDADSSIADPYSAGSSPSASPASSPGDESDPTRAHAKAVRQHLHLLKLAVERLGNWPKDYAEYERLNSDVFRMFREDLQGIKGLDKCNLRQFGAGRAEASDDLIKPGSLPQMDLGMLAIAV
ncbi:hypothetical protein ASPCAL14946 [Aspergillus calidoustus]|uniref:Uncharacterized protein n=1 Tax=Aspergillus calidoustus TaxID=454130 RepID=A0A0U5GIE6_ASPCI|nr:hypothetical protein ASPCAL14946 [Aspergillus calidoustus]